MDDRTQQLIDSVIRALEAGELVQAQGLVAALAQVGQGDAALRELVEVAKEYLALAPRLRTPFAKVLGFGVATVLRGAPLEQAHRFLADLIRADPGAATVFLGLLDSSPGLYRLFGAEASNSVSETALDPTAREPLKGLVSVPMAAGGVVGIGTVVLLVLRFVLKAGTLAGSQDREIDDQMNLMAQMRIDLEAVARKREQDRPVPVVRFSEAPADFKLKIPRASPWLKMVLARVELGAVEGNDSIDRLVYVSDSQTHVAPLAAFRVDDQARELIGDDPSVRAWVLVYDGFRQVPQVAQFGWRSAFGVLAVGPEVQRQLEPIALSVLPPATGKIEGWDAFASEPECRWLVLFRYEREEQFVLGDFTLGGVPPLSAWMLDDALLIKEPPNRFLPAPRGGRVAMCFGLGGTARPTVATYKEVAVNLPRLGGVVLPKATRAALLGR